MIASVRCLALSLCVLVPGSLHAQVKTLDPDLPYQGARSERVTYQVDFSAVVTPPYKCKVLRVWMPIPPSDDIQTVTASKLSAFPIQVEPKIGKEPTYGNQFACFEFREPQGAQILRHQFTIATHEVNWNVDLAKVQTVQSWPKSFDRYLRSEKLVPTDGPLLKLAESIVGEKSSAGKDLSRVFDWVQSNISYSHKIASLQGSAIHAFEKRIGHCSDYHGLCTALGRALGYPTRIVYGINPYPKNSPSHCKLEAFLPPYGWVAFDVSDTQQLVAKIQKDASLDDVRKARLADAARKRFLAGFRDNTWFMQTRGSGYDLEPPAKQKVGVVRTVYVEADGVAIPEPDPANPEEKAHTWATVHHYVADRPVTNPLLDWKSLEK